MAFDFSSRTMFLGWVEGEGVNIAHALLYTFRKRDKPLSDKQLSHVFVTFCAVPKVESTLDRSDRYQLRVN